MLVWRTPLDTPVWGPSVQLTDIIIEIIGDRKIWYHDPVAGSDLHMTHSSSNNLTFCKVYGPFSKVNENGLHFTTPEDSDNHDLLR